MASKALSVHLNREQRDFTEKAAACHLLEGKLLF